VTRTKANALVHYARLHSKDWIPAYNKDKGCTHCKAKFSSVAAYLYHCTGCMPCNNTHRDMISRMIDKE
jgi:protein-arginine kinase activator protein McsA